MQNLKEITSQVGQLAKTVGAFMRAEQQKITAEDVLTKSHNSLVSYVDVEAEKRLVAGLREIVPHAGFLTEEETTSQEKGETYWIIDPLDGTTNFLHGLPIFAVSVALMDRSKLTVGVIYEVGKDELFTAHLGGGAFLNGEKISVGKAEHLKDTLLATGFPYYDFGRMDNFLNLLRDCFEQTRGMRRMGSAATDLAYVAAGRFNGFFEYGLHPWDVAAGILLVTEAGGKVSDFNGGDSFLFGDEIVCAAEPVFEDLYKLVNQHLGK